MRAQNKGFGVVSQMDTTRSLVPSVAQASFSLVLPCYTVHVYCWMKLLVTWKTYPWLFLFIWPWLFGSWIVLSTNKSISRWISITKTNNYYIIQWIVIYPVDSAIQLLNSCAQMFSLSFDFWTCLVLGSWFWLMHRKHSSTDRGFEQNFLAKNIQLLWSQKTNVIRI